MQMMTNTAATTEPHVAVFAFPFGSHAAPLIAITRQLAAASPTAHFSFFSTSQSNKSIFSTRSTNIIAPNNITAQDVSDGVPENYVFTSKRQEDIELFMKAAPKNFRQGVEAAVAETKRKVSCLVTDAFLWFAAEMAEEMGVPWVPFWAPGPNSLSAHVYTNIIRNTVGVGGGIMGREDEPLKFIPGMSKLRIRDLPEGVVFGNMDSLFSQMLHKMGVMLPRATAVLINSFEEFDLTMTNDLKSKFNKFLNVGPFNLISAPPPVFDDGCLSWLNNQRVESVVYISFGSVAIPPQIELEAIAEALEASGVTFLWSLKDNVKENLPNGFLERTRKNGMVVPWTPQLQVLAHDAVGVFITHCGWNSLLESVGGGVPLICRPFFGDQRINVGMVVDVLEIGVRVEGGVFTKNGLLNCLDVMLSQDEGKKMREKIWGLKQAAEIAVGKNGSSTKNLKILLDLVVSMPT